MKLNSNIKKWHQYVLINNNKNNNKYLTRNGIPIKIKEMNKQLKRNFKKSQKHTQVIIIIMNLITN